MLTGGDQKGVAVLKSYVAVLSCRQRFGISSRSYNPGHSQLHLTCPAKKTDKNQTLHEIKRNIAICTWHLGVYWVSQLGEAEMNHYERDANLT